MIDGRSQVIECVEQRAVEVEYVSFVLLEWCHAVGWWVLGGGWWVVGG